MGGGGGISPEGARVGAFFGGFPGLSWEIYRRVRLYPRWVGGFPRRVNGYPRWTVGGFPRVDHSLGKVNGCRIGPLCHRMA